MLLKSKHSIIMARIFHILLLLLAFDVGIVSAQNVVDNRRLITATGKVVSVTDDEPLIGASVAVKGTKRGVATDFEGKYSIEAPLGSTLVVTYVGYDKAEVTAGYTTKIVRLIPAKPVSGWIYCDGNRVPQPQSDTIRPVTVTGKVISATDGQPLIAATVLYRNSANGKYLPKVVTDYDGRFELDFVPQDTLMVKLIGYKTQKFMPTDDPILIRIEEDSTEVFGCPVFVVYPVSGEVLDENGVPIAGAAVKVKDTYKEVTTGLNGEFEIYVQKGDVLEITCPGYKTQKKKASIKKPMKIKLKPKGK